MITIKYYSSGSTGEMNIDIIKFIENENHTLHDISFLCKKVVGISYERWEIAKEIIDICEKKIPEEKHKLQKMVDSGEKRKTYLNAQVRLIKKYQRTIELLKSYAG